MMSSVSVPPSPADTDWHLGTDIRRLSVSTLIGLCGSRGTGGSAMSVSGYNNFSQSPPSQAGQVSSPLSDASATLPRKAPLQY